VSSTPLRLYLVVDIMHKQTVEGMQCLKIRVLKNRVDRITLSYMGKNTYIII